MRYVVALPSNERRREYLDEVRKARGDAAADDLRSGAWALMNVKREGDDGKTDQP